MIIKIDEDGQVKLPESLMETLQVSPGDELEVRAGIDWFTASRRREKSLPIKELDLSKLKAFRERIAADPKYSEMEDAEKYEKRVKKKIDLTELEAFHATLNIDPNHEPFDIHEVRRRMIGR